MGPCERFSHPTHTSSARYWPATSQSDREVGKTAKTHVHAEYDGVAVELVTAELLYLSWKSFSSLVRGKRFRMAGNRCLESDCTFSWHQFPQKITKKS